MPVHVEIRPLSPVDGVACDGRKRRVGYAERQDSTAGHVLLAAASDEVLQEIEVRLLAHAHFEAADSGRGAVATQTGTPPTVPSVPSARW